MDALDGFRRIIQDTLAPYANRRYSYGDVRNELVFDIERDRYLVVSVGRDHRGVRIDGTLVHIDIIDGKVWLQRDNTADVIAETLIDAGIPKSDIVLGFQPPDLRPHTGYAVA